jgi:glycosyltransferase EpsE
MVSVIMATYNDKLSYLTKAVESILNQSYRNLEFIIVDDSNKEETIQYLFNLSSQDNRVKIIHNERKQGFVKSLNIGLKASKGKYIARMDSDDISILDRIEKQVKFMEANSSVSILGTGIIIIDENGEIKGERKYKSSFEEIKKSMFFRNPLAHPSTLFRKEIIDKIGPYDEKFIMAEDYELWLRAIKKGIIIENLEEYLLQYRMVSDYHKKRSYNNWKFNMLSKVKNFNSRYFTKNILGIILSVVFMITPGFVLNKLYNRDRKKPLIFGK